MRTLAERLAWARKEKTDRDGADFTQTDLATKAGVSQGAIGHLESGRTVTSRSITSIAKALDVDPIWLAEGKGTPYPTTQNFAAPPTADTYLPQPRAEKDESAPSSVKSSITHVQRVNEEEAELLTMYRLMDEEWRKRLVDAALSFPKMSLPTGMRHQG
ncbi:MAG: helix-turn-helix domain-containing protein [Burkholderiaceae bacterium]|nr:helix-turn-helix domain-containing protein [Burkholderiaceae bacterium]